MSRYFVTGVGRSGTTWLAKTLAEASGQPCHHEPVAGLNTRVPHAYSPFPVERWKGEDYGECHGLLRYQLSPEFLGPEMQIPHRAVIFRDAREVIASWMSSTYWGEELFPCVCHEVLTGMDRLYRWAALSEAEVYHVKHLWADLDYFRMLCDTLGLSCHLAELPSAANAGLQTFEFFSSHNRILSRVAEHLNCTYLLP